MNTSISPTPGCGTAPSRGAICSLPSATPTGEGRDFASAPAEQLHPDSIAPSVTASALDRSLRNLLEACLRMLKLTGGSHYWTGDTQAALEFMEAAVEEALATEALRNAQNGAAREAGEDSHALEEGTSRHPRPTASGVVPEILATAPATVECGLHLAGVELECQRS